MKSRVFLLVAGACAVLLGTAGRAHAQAGIPYLAEPSEEPATEAPPPPTEPQLPQVAPDLSLVQRSRPRGHPPTYFADLWSARRAALSAGDAARAESALKQIVQAKAESGWPDFFAMGEALARESRTLALAGKHPAAVEVGRAAVALAPHDSHAHLALAAALWTQGGAAGEAILQALSAAWQQLREPPLRRRLVGNLVLAWLSGLLVAVALFAIAILYRHSRAFGHDLQHLLASAGGRWLSVAVGGALVLSPVLLALGPLWALLIWACLMAVYFDMRERIGAVFALAFLSSLPFVVPSTLAFLEAPSSTSQEMYDAARDMQADRAVEGIRARAPTAESLYVLGMRARWSGELDEATRLLGSAVELGANDTELATTLGNVRFWLGDARGAIEAYERAIEVDADNAVAYFNLSRVYYAITEHQKAGEAYRKASSLDYEAVEDYSERAKREGPGFVVSVGAAKRLLSLPIEPGILHQQAASQLWHWIAGGTRRLFFAFYGIAATLVVILLGWLRHILGPSAACRRCGKPACRRCNPELPDRTHCGQCFHAFVSDDGIEPQVKIQKEIEVRRFQARTRRIRHVLAVLVVGGPDIARGDALRGVLWTSVFAGLILLFAAALGWLPSPVRALAGYRAVPASVYGFVLAVIYGLGVWRGLREEASAWL